MSTITLTCPACKAEDTLVQKITTSHAASYDTETGRIVAQSKPVSKTTEDTLHCGACDTSVSSMLAILASRQREEDKRAVVLPQYKSNRYYILSNIDSHGSTRDELASLSGVLPAQTTQALNKLAEQGLVSEPGDDERWNMTDYGRRCQQSLLSELAIS